MLVTARKAAVIVRLVSFNQHSSVEKWSLSVRDPFLCPHACLSQKKFAYYE